MRVHSKVRDPRKVDFSILSVQQNTCLIELDTYCAAARHHSPRYCLCLPMRPDRIRHLSSNLVTPFLPWPI